VYDYCRPPGDHTIVVSNDFVGTTDRQTKAYLLCLECENDLNKGGEAWLLPLLAEYDGPFPLYEMLTQYRAEIVQGDASWYSAAHNPGIHCDKLTHFAMGVFWKAAAHSWRGGKNEPLINLGPYAEPVRRFLRSEAPFPEKMALTIVVLPAPVRLITLELPHRGPQEEWHQFSFYIPGIRFVLAVGKSIPETLRKYCFVRNGAHPILVTDLSGDMDRAIHNTLTLPRNAKQFEKLAKRTKRPT